MRSKAYGAINIVLIVTVCSGMLNLFQGAYNFKYHRASEKAASFEKLNISVKKELDGFDAEFDAAKTEMEEEVRRLRLPDAEVLKASIQKIEDYRALTVVHVQEDRQIYKDVGKSYKPPDLAYLNHSSLRELAKAALTERYGEIRRKAEADELVKFFAFVAAVDPTWVRVTTRESVNVRSGPLSNAKVVAAIPEDSVCKIVSVSADQSWVEVKGEAPNHFRGWVYVQYLETPTAFLLN